jgi:hypothetical protein
VAVGDAFDYVGVATETGAYDGGLTSNTQVTSFGTVLGGAGDNFNAYQLFDNREVSTGGKDAYIESFKSNSTFAWIDPSEDPIPVLMKDFDVVIRSGWGGRSPDSITVEGFDPDKGTWVHLQSFSGVPDSSTTLTFSGSALSQKVIGLRFTLGPSSSVPMNLAEIKPHAYEIEYRAEPSVEDYVLAGFTSVTEDNLYAVNRALEGLTPANNSALSEVDVTTAITTAASNITSALSTIDAYAKTDGGGTAPTLETYLIAGLQGVTAANKSAIDTAVAGVDNATGIPDLVALKSVSNTAVQGYLNALSAIIDFAEGYTTTQPTFADFVNAGMTSGLTIAPANEAAFARAAAFMLSDLDSLTATKISFAVASMQANIESLANTIEPSGDQTSVISTLYDYTAVVGMDTLAEYTAENTEDGFDLSKAEFNILLGNALIDDANYQEALERVISQESLPVDNPSDVNEQFYLFQNQITSDVYIEYATVQAAGDTTPYIQIVVDDDSVGEAWDIVYKTTSGDYTTILSNHVVTQAEADQGFITVNDGVGPITTAVSAADGYINVVKHGDVTPIAADYFFDYQ